MHGSFWQKTSLRARLVLAMVGLVGGVVLSISVVYFHALARNRLDDARDRSAASMENVKSFVLERVAERMRQLPRRPRTLEESRILWTTMIRSDVAVQYLLRNIVANSTMLLDIVVTDADGLIVSAPDQEQVGLRTRNLPDFETWYRQGVWKRLKSILTEDRELDLSIPLGVADQNKSLFYIRGEVSTVMMRTALYPDLRSLALASGGMVLLSILAGAVVATLLLRPLERLNRTIDRLSRGEMAVEPSNRPESREFAAVQQKLGLLARQFRGAREDVQQMRENIGRMLQRLEEAVLLFDPDDRLVAAGTPAERLLNASHPSLIGRSLTDLFPPESSLGAAILRTRDAGHSTRDVDVEVCRADGPPVRLLLNVDPLNDGSSSRLGMVVTLRDAETRTQLETQLDVSSRVAAISRLTGGVAHEIKNPLNAIALHLEVLRAQLAASEASHRSEIDIISAEVSRLDRVVKAFIDFTRPVAFDVKPVDMEEVVTEAAAHLNVESKRRNIELMVQIAEGPKPVLLGDKIMLRQAVLNVLVNAIESMEQGGKVEIDLRQSFGDYVLSVCDQGPGIPAEIRDRIFNLFYTTKRSAGGVGLAIAFQVVQLHNGTIECDNRPEGGAIFRLRFPAVHGQAARTFGAGGNASR